MPRARRSAYLARARQTEPIVPFPQQAKLLERSEFEVFIHGGRHGGKTFGALLDWCYQVQHPRAKGLVLRRSWDQLKEIIELSQRIYPQLGGVWYSSDKEWHFPSGAVLYMGFLEREEQIQRYWGHGYTWAFIDEIQHWSFKTYKVLLTSIRTQIGSGVQCSVRLSGNPLGIGHRWLRDYFIRAGAPETPIYDADTKLYRCHLISGPDDNPYTPDEYKQRLEQLDDEAQRRAWRFGDWDIVEGAMFKQWDEKVHVVEPFPIPESWPRFRSADYGFADPMCVLWWAVDPWGGLVCYRELWVVEQTVDRIAKLIRDIEDRAGESKLQLCGPLDTQAWDRNGCGTTPADRFFQFGVRWYKALKGPGSRIHGCSEMHYRLGQVLAKQRDELTGREIIIPGIRFFNTCRWTVDTIPHLQRDPSNPEDTLEAKDDHAWDAVRYALRYRPTRGQGIKDGRVLGPKPYHFKRLSTRDRSRSPITGY